MRNVPSILNPASSRLGVLWKSKSLATWRCIYFPQPKIGDVVKNFYADRRTPVVYSLRRKKHYLFLVLNYGEKMYHKSVAVRLAYGSMSLFIAILHNVFLLYYVDIFVSVYKIDRNSFWLGEVGAFVFVSSGLFCCLMKTMFCLWKIRPGTLNKIWICKILDKKITHLR